MKLMSRKGFTLVELLVVITIIGVLARVGFTFFQGTQTKARDTKRKQDIRSLSSALALYYQNNNQYIQSTSSTCNSGDTQAFYTAISSYMASGAAPKDPKNGEQYCYFSVNNGLSYRLFAKLENCSDPEVLSGCVASGYNFSIASEDLALAGPTPTPTPTPIPTSIPTSTPTPTPTQTPTPTPTPTPIPTPTPTPTSIVFDAVTTTTGTGTTTYSWSHTSGSGSNRIIVVGVSLANTGSGVSSVSYAGQSLTKLRSDTSGTASRSEIWYLLNPPSGANTTVVTLAATQNMDAVAMTWFNVNSTTPLGTSAGSNSGGVIPASDAISVTLPSTTTSDVVIDVVSIGPTTSSAVCCPGAGQTQRATLNVDTATANGMTLGSSSKLGTASTTVMSWRAGGPTGSNYWAISAVPLKF